MFKSKSKVKKYGVIILSLILMMSSLIGCSKNEPANTNTADDTNIEVTENETVKEPKIFTYSIGSDPATFDPQLNTAGDGVTINSNLFEGLVVTDEKMQPLPGVAKDWEISSDGLEYTFYLREDAKWKDGTPITTEDFIYSWSRVLNPEINAKYASHLFYLKNAKAIYNGDMDISKLGVEAVDTHTLKVTLEASTPYIMQLFARNIYAPVHKDTVEANPENWAAHPETCMSNGPFIMKEYALNERVVLVKNENYWNSDAIKLDELRFVFIGDSGTALSAFEMGEIDGTASIPSAQIPTLILQNDEFHVRPRLSTRYLAFNNQVAPLDNIKVREALSKSVDRSLITDNITLGGEVPATGIVPFNMIVDGKDFRETAGDYGISVTAMVEESQALLAEAGYPNGEGWPEGVELIYSDNDLYKSIAEALQQMWKTTLNIDIELVSVESKVANERRRNGEFTITIAGWGADYSYPLTFLDMWTSESGTNYARYNNPEYDDLINQVRNSSDPAESLALLYKAEELAIGTDYIIAPLHYRNRLILMRKNTSGWYINSLGKYYFMYTDVNN